VPTVVGVGSKQHKDGTRKMSKLPFIPSLFFKTFAVVVVLVIVTWWLVLSVFYPGYNEGKGMSPADYGGTTISTILFTYLVHLWLMPIDDLPDDEEHDEND